MCLVAEVEHWPIQPRKFETMMLSDLLPLNTEQAIEVSPLSPNVGEATFNDLICAFCLHSTAETREKISSQFRVSYTCVPLFALITCETASQLLEGDGCFCDYCVVVVSA